MIGIIYLARGKDLNWQKRFSRFVESYLAHHAGLPHRLYVIYKEFDGVDELGWAKNLFKLVNAVDIEDYLDTNSFAGGSFLEAARHIKESYICAFGSSTEIMHDNWLFRLMQGYVSRPNVGLVCCTGSYGFIHEFFPQLTYPNPHIRNLSFLMERELYMLIANAMPFESKLDDLKFEHGPLSLTQQVLAMGKQVLVVEKEAIRDPSEWGGQGGTTYIGNLENVLVHDRGARSYNDL